MSSNNSRHTVAAYPFSKREDGGVSDEKQKQQQQQQQHEMDAETGLRQLKAELDSIPDNMKASFVHAQHVAPDLVCDQHLSRFLYAEGYDVKLAARRVVNYWKHRNKVFGEDYTFPLTLSGAMKSHIQSLYDGFLNLLPLKDNFGRAIIFSDPIKLAPARFDNQVRVWWYLVHVAMNDDVALRNGFIIISNARSTTLNNFDAKTTAAICTSGDRFFPIRWRQTHCCHTNPVFPLVAAMVKSVLSKEQRETFVLHNGTCEQVLESFREEGIPKECLPTDLGGSIIVSPERFVRERLTVEGCFKSEESDNASQLCVRSTENAMGSTVDSGMQVPEKKPIDHMKTAKKKASNATKQSVQPGRPGDPRMNAAVQAKLEDPDLPLLEALAAGGFVFEDINKPGVKSSEVRDKDGVTVYQRRNQLLRRLRKERKRAQI
mmetsp:Transcript_5297/g.7729  ORF Transcript_5297/g.7729 Transcript_5297/m.7729 type:complete len:432 (+) Transcript_5297:151-1446(+)